MPKKKVVKETVTELVPSGSLKLTTSSGGSLELMMRNKEPSVLVDGKYVIRYTTLSQALSRKAKG